MAKVIMVQGTMSGAGKSLIVAGLCRIFKQDGYRVAPFKSQNMALNSYITEDGLEMGRAQVMQAEAAGIKPMVCMNPILLKPTNDVGSQVIVNGEVIGNMKAKDYFAFKKSLVPDIKTALYKLAEQVDIIVIEGAGSPAEINLKENDIVNMGMAEIANANVLLVGDIDRGGVFAQLLGTVDLLEEDERARVKGLIINKFRGDKSILDPGVVMLEERSGIPVTGVVPYMRLLLEDEDSLSERFDKHSVGLIDIAVIKLPRLSNYSDFDVFEQFDAVSVRYVSSVHELGNPDMIIIPGSKNTISDMKWMRESGLENAILKAASAEDKRIAVVGICGGYQMLGTVISDPFGVEGEPGSVIRGMSLLPVETKLNNEKTRAQFTGHIEDCGGIFASLSGLTIEGYEIHMGETCHDMQAHGLMPCECEDSASAENVMEPALLSFTSNATGYSCGNIYGTYIHGFMDNGKVAETIIRSLAQNKGIEPESFEGTDYSDIKEAEFDKLASAMREHMDMDAVYGMLNEIK